jgi:hypothetical protein
MKEQLIAGSFALALACVAGPSVSNAAFFVGQCGGSQVKAISLNAACKKHEGKKLVSCKKICNKRKGLKCVSHTWRTKVTKQCPMKSW